MDIYRQENFNKNIKDIATIKFKGKQFNNVRIYCKDFYSDIQRIIILSELLESKKQNKLTQKEKTLINKVNNYDYS